MLICAKRAGVNECQEADPNYRLRHLPHFFSQRRAFLHTFCVKRRRRTTPHPFLRESYTVEQYGAENLVIDDSELNIAKPGIYKVTIYCERGDATGSATLLVAVTDSVSAS